eukprot:399482-Alexandrium_andersonii.AAC.1
MAAEVERLRRNGTPERYASNKLVRSAGPVAGQPRWMAGAISHAAGPRSGRKALLRHSEIPRQ